MFRIYPYKVGSASARALKDALGAMIIKLENSRYRYRNAHTIINWGNSRRPSWMSTDVPVINQPESVEIASNKLDTFERLQAEMIATVPWTTDKSLAQGWLNDGVKVFVRHSLTGHSGEGIEVISPREESDFNVELTHIINRLRTINYHSLADNLIEDLEDISVSLPDAPLYTYGVSNTGEYRVHVFDGEVILYQKKSRRVNEETGEVVTAEGEEADVRNLASNWVYRTGNLRRLERVEELAINAVRALGLDFGAVDIIKDENGEVYVLEVNTAPGLGNEATLEAYVRAFNGEPAQLPELADEYGEGNFNSTF